MRDAGSPIVREELDHGLTQSRPLGYGPEPFQAAGITALEGNHPRQQTFDEGACVQVRGGAHRRPLCQRSASVNLLHARLHVVVMASGRNQDSAARKPRQQHRDDGCGAVFALVTWEAGLITTRPLLQ